VSRSSWKPTFRRFPSPLSGSICWMNTNHWYIQACHINAASYSCIMQQEGGVKLCGHPSDCVTIACRLTRCPCCQLFCFLCSVLFGSDGGDAEDLMKRSLTQYWKGWSHEKVLVHLFAVKASNLKYETLRYAIFYSLLLQPPFLEYTTLNWGPCCSLGGQVSISGHAEWDCGGQ
jgi:hypothetical protein